MTLPTARTPAAVGAGAWTAAAGRLVPGILGEVSALAAYAAWVGRRRRWHDLVVVAAALLPAVGAGVWARGYAGVALSGLACALAGYQGRHRPDGP